MAVPSRVMTNHDLEKLVDTSDEWITERTGIKQRYVAENGTATSDLAADAALRALEAAGVDPMDVDQIIVATVTPDYPMPSAACLVQHHIGARRASAFDLSAACSGYVYALSIADNAIRAGAAHNILVIGADCLTKITDFTDRNTCVLFGDGAGAALVQASDEPGVLGSRLFSDGSKLDLLYVPAGGSREPVTPETVEQRKQYIVAKGRDVFRYAVQMFPDATRAVLEACDLELDDIKLIIPHQANRRILETGAERLGIGMDRVLCNIDRYGNTTAATVIIGLDEAVREGRIQQGDHVVLVSFGAGFTWGATALRW